MAKNVISEDVFNEFVTSSDTLRVYHGEACVFRSDKDVLAPLVEYISEPSHQKANIIILDKVIGNAAALLAVKAGATGVYSPLGSEPATKTLSRYKIDYHLKEIVPFILARNGKDLCPMEKLSLDKTPQEFYETVKPRFESSSKTR